MILRRKWTILVFALVVLSTLNCIYFLVLLKRFYKDINEGEDPQKSQYFIHHSELQLKSASFPIKSIDFQANFVNFKEKPISNQIVKNSSNMDIISSDFNVKISQEYLKFVGKHSLDQEDPLINIGYSNWANEFLYLLQNESIPIWRSQNIILDSDGRYQVDVVEDGRVLQQTLMTRFNFSGSDSKPAKILYLVGGKDWWVKNMGFEDGGPKCPALGLGPCSITFDHPGSNWERTAQIQVVDSFHNPSRVQSPPDRAYNLFFSFESPYAQKVILNRDRDLFGSYWRGSDLLVPYFSWMYHDPNIRRIKANKDYTSGKSKMAAIFVSNCGAKNNRIGFVKELQEHMSVDVYGSCGDLKCPKKEMGVCLELLQKDYFFFLAFENSNCRDYITEKFLNALKYDVIPVVLGAHPDDYQALAPSHSYIHVEDFSSPADLALFLKSLASDSIRYNEYFEWKEAGHIIQAGFLCRVCAMLHLADYLEPPKREGRGFQFTPDKMCLRKHSWYWRDK